MNVEELLNSFSDEEKTSFVRFCQSPISNIRPQGLELFRLLRRSGSDPPGPETLWEGLFPRNKPYNDATFRKIRSDLYQEMARFLSFRSYERRKEGETDFLSELQSRRLWPLWKREYRRLNDHWQSSGSLGAHHHHQNFRLAYAGFGSSAYVPDIDAKEAFNEVEHSLDRYYITWKLRVVVNRLIYQGIFGGEENRSAEQLIGSGLLDKHLDDPVIEVYYRLYTLYATGKEHLFRGLVESLDQLDFASPDERYEIGSHVLNYAIRRANNGSREYMKATFCVCEVLLANGDLFQGSQISGLRYFTVVRFGLATGKRKFVKTFMRKYGHNLTGSDGEDYHNLAWSNLHFYEGRLQEALECLPDAERKNIFLDLNVRMLRLRILFEMQDEEAEKCFNSLKMKVFRLSKQNMLSQRYLELYRRMILMMSKLLRIGPNDDAQDLLVDLGDLPAELGMWITKMVLRRRKHIYI